jgi:hypothetical protein
MRIMKYLLLYYNLNLTLKIIKLEKDYRREKKRINNRNKNILKLKALFIIYRKILII